MKSEATGFFREVLARNLSIREFIASDWTVLNERLATHYGITGVRGETFQRVSLKPDMRRGGLLTQAAILSLTSDGSRHRPVHRGTWILDTIFGKPPPPPPANVAAIETTAAGQPKMTLRAKLESHRNDPNCIACHRKIDPLGLAFENYDAIGRWRTTETMRDGSGANPEVDSRGELADGRTFAGAAELKQLMIADTDQFAEALLEKLATYALRRAVTFGERADLRQIAARHRAAGYPLASLIESFVASSLFQKR